MRTVAFVLAGLVLTGTALSGVASARERGYVSTIAQRGLQAQGTYHIYTPGGVTRFATMVYERRGDGTYLVRAEGGRGPGKPNAFSKGWVVSEAKMKELVANSR